MNRPPSLRITPDLTGLRDPTAPASTLTTALKTLKNEVVGHEQRKEDIICHGIVPLLTNILAARVTQPHKRSTSASSGAVLGSGLAEVGGELASSFRSKFDTKRKSRHRRDRSDRGEGKFNEKATLYSQYISENASRQDIKLQADHKWTEEDEVRLQATMLIGSLGYGGSTLVPPLLAGGVAGPLLAACSTETHPRLIIASLETLLVIANITASRRSRIDTTDSPIDATDHSTTVKYAEQIYSESNVKSLLNIIAQPFPSPTVTRQVTLIAKLISKTCIDNKHRKLLAKMGMLDHLAARFAATALMMIGNPVVSSCLSLPPSVGKDGLFLLIEAIASIIQHSKYRTAQFLYSPHLLAVFALPLRHGKNTDFRSFKDQDRSLLEQSVDTKFSIDISLPQIHPVYVKGDRNVHGQAGVSNNSHNNKSHQGAQNLGFSSANENLFAWLISLARNEHHFNRLITIWFLTIITNMMDVLDMLNSSNDYKTPTFDRSLALLVVPLLINIIDESIDTTFDLKQNSASAVISVNPKLSILALEEMRVLRECTPTVLALLAEDSNLLRKAAVEAGAIKKLCQALKKTFDPTSSDRKAMWTSHPNRSSRDEGDDKFGAPPISPTKAVTLGHVGMSAEMLHALKCRRSTLRALAAIANKEDSYRRMIIENGIVSCIISSLLPLAQQNPDIDAPMDHYQQQQQSFRLSSAQKNQSDPTLTDRNGELNNECGNPVPVLVGACNAARAMSRSVQVLRTSLIDAGIARPIFSLVKHPNEEVQIAAMDVMCNLLLEVSPMREELIEAGAVETLCVYAHKSAAGIRMMSLWALKHVVLAAPKELRVRCVNQLGPEWLMQIISGNDVEGMPNNGVAQNSNRHLQPHSGMETSNAAGERVDILNAVDEPVDISMSNESSSANDQKDVKVNEGEAMHNHEYSRLPYNIEQMNKLSDHTNRGMLQLRQRWYSNFKSMASHEHATLQAIRLGEEDPKIVALKENLRIQEQVLDIIRNLITENGAFEMIDFLLGTLGPSRLFDVLRKKLSSASIWSSAGSSSTVNSNAPPPAFSTNDGSRNGVSNYSTNTSKHDYSQHMNRKHHHIADNILDVPLLAGLKSNNILPQENHSSPNQNRSEPSRQQQIEQQQQNQILRHQSPEILIPTIFILVHIAAGTPRHRSLLISQQNLLRSVLPLFSHPDRRIRVACVWLVNNLTWIDDAADTPAARVRALELRNLGYEDRLLAAISDPDLDVRERAKTALEQSGKLLGATQTSTSGGDFRLAKPSNVSASIAASTSGVQASPTPPLNIPPTSHPPLTSGPSLTGTTFGPSPASGSPGINSRRGTAPRGGGNSSGNAGGNGSGNSRPTFGR